MSERKLTEGEKFIIQLKEEKEKSFENFNKYYEITFEPIEIYHFAKTPCFSNMYRGKIVSKITGKKWTFTVEKGLKIALHRTEMEKILEIGWKTDKFMAWHVFDAYTKIRSQEGFELLDKQNERCLDK